MTSLARREREALADLATVVGPDAHTLCGDWTVRDLLAHLVVRESSPLGAPGILVPALSGLTDREMAKVAARPFDEVVERVRRPARFSFSSLAPVDAVANRLEFFVHHEDVRRARREWEPRALARRDQDSLWQALRVAARPMLRRTGVPVTLVRTDTGEELVLGGDGERVVMSGPPSELVLHCYGREQSVVELSGRPSAVERLRAANLGL